MSVDVLVVEDDVALRQALCDTLQMAGLEPLAAGDGSAGLAALREAKPRLVVSDIQMQPMDGMRFLRAVRAERPEAPVLLMTAYATVQQAVEAMREGAVDYLVKPFEAQVLVSKVLDHLPAGAPAPSGMVAEDPASRQLLALAERVAASEATVLITGESGTGKEVLARHVHGASGRAGGPFVAINCAAIPDNMLEAVLFGYEKGAFTGAYRASPGKFEQAQQGTLLLDEISEMDLGLQAKLLRVLQEKEVERLGAGQVIALDVRVLATSNRDLQAEVRAGRFREDLYYRLNVFPLHLPPLRERPADIVPLAAVLLARHAAPGPAPRLDDDARRRLAAHAWPGNVRELDNVMQRALILQQGGMVTAADLHFETVAPASMPAPEAAPAAADAPLGHGMRRHERDLIIQAIQEGGSRQAAAGILGISPRTLRYKLQKLREAGMPVPEQV
jgi:two-component system response regulator FlrC